MECKKCGYNDINNKKVYGKYLCSICRVFAPQKIHDFQEYLLEKIDWKSLDTFRKFGHVPGTPQKKAMAKKAAAGIIMARPPLGYDVVNGALEPNPDASKVHSLFKTFLSRNYSLNSLAKNFSLSVNGLKKILTNRVYIGEIKFDGKIHKSSHAQIISPEIFYAVQRKLENYIRPRNKTI